MSNYDHPSQRIGLQVLLFILSLLVISWPMLAQTEPWSLKELMSFLFAIWTTGVALLFFISRSTQLSRKTALEDEFEEPEDFGGPK